MQPTRESISAPDSSHIPDASDNGSITNPVNLQSPPTTTECNRSLRIFYSNAGGMRSKVSSFYAAVSVCEYEVIIIITETWLTLSVLDSELSALSSGVVY